MTLYRRGGGGGPGGGGVRKAPVIEVTIAAAPQSRSPTPPMSIPQSAALSSESVLPVMLSA